MPEDFKALATLLNAIACARDAARLIYETFRVFSLCECVVLSTSM